MRLWPAVISSLLALPGLVVMIGGINELSSDSEQLANLIGQFMELVQSHSDILDSLLSVLTALLSLIGITIGIAAFLVLR